MNDLKTHMITRHGTLSEAEKLYTVLFAYQDGASVLQSATLARATDETTRKYLRCGDFDEFVGRPVQHRMKISEDDGKRILTLDSWGFDAGRIADALENRFHKASISRWLKEHGRKSRMGNPRIVKSEEQIDALIDSYLVDGNNWKVAAADGGMCAQTGLKYLKREKIKTGRWKRDIVIGGVLVNKEKHFEGADIPFHRTAPSNQ